MLTWFKYVLERWVLRGSIALVVLLVAVLCLLALGGGALAYFLPGSPFATYQEALWWATLRLSDPGYLSDDAGVEVRILSVALSVLGMGVTVGGIVAIVTQALMTGLRNLSQATTKVPFKDHVVLLGWTDRTPRLLRRLLARRKRGKIVILLEEVNQEAMKRVAREVPKTRQLERVVLRSGSVYRPWELDRAACRDAEAVLVPATTEAVSGDPQSGPRTLQTMIALRNLFAEEDDEDRPPTVAVELVDRSMAPVVASTLPGVRVLQSDRVVARVLRFCLQGENLVQFALDVATPHRGYRVESVHWPELAGLSLFEAERQLVEGKLMGHLRENDGGRRSLTVRGDYVLKPEDRLLVFGRGHVRVDPTAVHAASGGVELGPEVLWPAKRKILTLGWNETAPDLLAELSQEAADRYEMDVLSVLEPELRRKMTETQVHNDRVPVRHYVGSPFDPYTLGSVSLADYDRVLILADRTTDPESADVRSLAIALAVEQRRKELKSSCYVLAELLDEGNREVLKTLQAVVTPRLAADTLNAMAFSSGGKETMAVTFSKWAAYTTRVVRVPAAYLKAPQTLARSLREHRLALMHAFDPPARHGEARILIAEAVQATDNEKHGVGS